MWVKVKGYKFRVGCFSIYHYSLLIISDGIELIVMKTCFSIIQWCFVWQSTSTQKHELGTRG